MLQGALLDGSAAALDASVKSEGLGAATIFIIKAFNDSEEDAGSQAILANALRRAFDAGMAVLQILRVQKRAEWRRDADPLQFFIRADFELPVDVFLAECIMKKTMRYSPGVILPLSDEQLTEPFHPLWWGVRLMTLNLEGFRERVEKIYSQVVRRWRDNNPKAWATSLEIKVKRQGLPAPGSAILHLTPATTTRTNPFGHHATQTAPPTVANGGRGGHDGGRGGRDGGRGGRDGGRGGRGRHGGRHHPQQTKPPTDPPIV